MDNTNIIHKKFDDSPPSGLGDVKDICYSILPMLKSVQYFAYSFFMHGLSIYEIKRICHLAYLFINSSGSFQHLTSFFNR